jgi:hypothetical protein
MYQCEMLFGVGGVLHFLRIAGLKPSDKDVVRLDSKVRTLIVQCDKVFTLS